MVTATNLQEALKIQEAGIDAIVAQGIEAGGHRGMFDPDAVDERLSTAVLVRLLAKHVRLPIIAAGGIMDGAGIKAMPTSVLSVLSWEPPSFFALNQQPESPRQL